MIKQHKENEIKKMKKIQQKKKTSETKKMITIEKQRVHMKKMTSRKRKREEVKITKKLEKISKLKRAYRRRLVYSAVSKQKFSISMQTFVISKNSILSMQKTRVRSFTFS